MNNGLMPEQSDYDADGILMNTSFKVRTGDSH
jgi:hypothetical protein